MTASNVSQPTRVEPTKSPSAADVIIQSNGRTAVLGFGGIGLILTVCVISMWLVRVTATADRSGLTITRRLLGLKTQRHLEADSIVAIVSHRTASSGEHVYHSLRATTDTYRTFSFGSGIEGRQLSERLAAAMLDALQSRKFSLSV